MNRWLKKRNYDPLEDIAGGWLGQNVCLFGGCYNKLDAEEFCKAVRKAKWRKLGDVRVLFWDEEDETFTLIPFPPKRPVRKAPEPD